jgi:hypothetical protein
VLWGALRVSSTANSVKAKTPKMPARSHARLHFG